MPKHKDDFDKSRAHVSQQATLNRSLFHYTDANGLIGILESGNLRATHYSFLNDYTEGQAILPLLLPHLEAQLRAAVPQLVNLGLFKRAILADINDKVYGSQAVSMLRAMTVATNRVAPFFIASFCIHDPSEPAYGHGLLSQWRGYGRGGFAIEFDELAIDTLNENERRTFRYQGILTNEVAYRNHGECLKPESFDGFAGAMLKNLFPDLTAELTSVLGTKTTNDFANAFLSAAPFLKNASFEEENEYRIVALCNRPSRSAETDKRKVKPMEFRARLDGVIVPFISLYEGLNEPLPIKAIVVGPHPRNEDRRVALEILLEKQKLNVPIRFSDIPFRD